MLLKSKMLAYCLIGFGLSYYSMNFIGSTVFAETNETKEVSTSKEDPCHGKSDMCCKGSSKGSCCMSQDTTGCKSDSCEHQHHSHHKDNMCNLMALAHSAKEELLKEKIKARLEAKIGKKLDKVADLVVDTMIDKYKKMSECEKMHDEFEGKLKEIFKEEEVKQPQPPK